MFKTLAATLCLAFSWSCLAAGGNLSSGNDTAARKSHLKRNLILGNLVCGAGAYFYFVETWGAPSGRFHFKDEAHDNVNYTDEVSHFFAGYKLTEGFRWLFRVLRMQPEKIDRYAALEAALATTLVEFPMDSFNPTQGLGWTDLVFNYAGIGWGLLEAKRFHNVDMKFSVKKPPWQFEHKFLASKNEEFDNFIWWGVWKPKYIWVGVGYSTNHEHLHAQSEVYLGSGTTLYDMLHVLKPKLADQLRALDCYFINVKIRL